MRSVTRVGFVPCLVALWIFAVAVTPPGVALIFVTSTYASLRSSSFVIERTPIRFTSRRSYASTGVSR